MQGTIPLPWASALARQISRRPATSLGLSLLVMLLVARLDQATDYALHLPILYLFPIALATWAGGLRSGALFVAFASVLEWLSLRSAPPYLGSASYYWEGVATVLVDVACVGLLAWLRIALTRSDARFVQVLEELQAAVYVADRDNGRILYANENLARLLGSDPNGLDAETLNQRFGVAPVGTPDRPAPQSNDGFVSHEARDPTNGRWYLVKSGPIPWTSRRHVSLQVITEISEQKQAQALKRQHQDMLHQTARLAALAEIASSLAHEVNQPLMAIATYNDAGLRLLGAEHFDKSELTNALQRSREQALRAGKIIRGVRDFIRSRRPSPTHCDINALVQEALEILETPLEESLVNVALSLSESPLLTHADQTLLVQVVLNLLQNAMDAMATSDPARRKLSIATTKATDGAIIVSISDQGPGIPADLGEQPYTPLFTTKPQGLGLGLSICRSVVEAHGGRIWHSRNIDGGCSFHFSLPPETG